MSLTSLPVFTLVLCQFTYDWIIVVIVHDVLAYFRQFLRLDIQMVGLRVCIYGVALSHVIGRLIVQLAQQWRRQLWGTCPPPRLQNPRANYPSIV